MSKRNREVLDGNYQFHGRILVPESLKPVHPRQIRSHEPPRTTQAPEAEEAESLLDDPILTEAAASNRPRPERRPRTKQIFDPAHVSQLEHSVAHLPLRNEQRLAIEGMLRDLKRRPDGQRELARVPHRLTQVCAHLQQEMPNFSPVIELVESLLTLQRAGDGAFGLPPLLLSGPPGVGKTYFAQRLAQLVQTSYELVHMESATAGWVLSGNDRRWANGSPGAVFDVLVHQKYANPIIVVDELDKVSTDSRYPPANGLYALLEPATAAHFKDEACREVPLDASAINWIVTANDATKIPAPLLSRLHVVDVPEPTFVERVAISRCVYRDMRAANSWGRRFAADLEHPAACALARVDGSVRSARSVLTRAFAQAFRRKSRRVEVQDIAGAICGLEKHMDLATIEPRGFA